MKTFLGVKWEQIRIYEKTLPRELKRLKRTMSTDIRNCWGEPPLVNNSSVCPALKTTNRRLRACSPFDNMEKLSRLCGYTSVSSCLRNLSHWSQDFYFCFFLGNVSLFNSIFYVLRHKEISCTQVKAFSSYSKCRNVACEQSLIELNMSNKPPFSKRFNTTRYLCIFRNEFLVHEPQIIDESIVVACADHWTFSVERCWKDTCENHLLDWRRSLCESVSFGLTSSISSYRINADYL